MDCSQIPAPELWDDASAENLKAYRNHLRYCRKCRENTLKISPEKLLFQLSDDPMPEEFWLGFWDSVSRKKQIVPHQRFPIVRVALRWTAVLIVGFVVAFYGRSFPDKEQTRSNVTSDYPVIENLRNPQARYYIFQTNGQKVVMVFDPEVEL